MIKILGAVACVLAVVVVMLAASVAAWAGQTNELEVNRAPEVERRVWNWAVQPDQAQTQEHAPQFDELYQYLRLQQMQARPGAVAAPSVSGPAGTWQIVTAAEHVLLLNTSTGATFRLVDKDTVRWEAVVGQHSARAGDPILLPWTRTIPEAPAKSLKVLEHELAVAEVALSDLKSALKHVTDRDTRTKLEREIKARSEKAVELQKQVEAARLREAVPAPAEKR